MISVSLVEWCNNRVSNRVLPGLDLMVHVQKYRFKPNKIVGSLPTSSQHLNTFLRQAPSGQHGEGNARTYQETNFLVECRPFYRIHLMVDCQKYPFKPNEIVGSLPTNSRHLSQFLCQAPSGQYGEGNARTDHEMYFLVECRPFYWINLMVDCQKYPFKPNEIVGSLPTSSRHLSQFLCPSSVGSTWRRECPDILRDVFFGRMPAILPHPFDG
jgi:hypothetical protein